VAFGGGSYPEAPEGWGECTQCDRGEVCEECERHPNTCECADKLEPHATETAPAVPLPPLADCPACEGLGRIWG